MRRYPPFSARSGWSFAEADALICLSLPWRDLWEDPKTKCREECTHQPWAPAPVAVMASSSTGTKPAGKQKSGAVFGPAPVGKSRQRLGSTTVTVLAALVAGLGGALGIIGKIAAAATIICHCVLL